MFIRSEFAVAKVTHRDKDILVEYPIISLDYGLMKPQEVYTKEAFQKLQDSVKFEECPELEHPIEFQFITNTIYKDIVDGEIKSVDRTQEATY